MEKQLLNRLGLENCKTRVKLISKVGKDDFSQSWCSLTISVGQPNHEEDRLLATIEKINKSFKHCNIMICDTLQRFNCWQFLPEAATESDMYHYALSEGKSWITRNDNILKNLAIPYKITLWDYWLKHPHFQLESKMFEKQLLHDQQYHDILNSTAQEYIDRLLARKIIDKNDQIKINFALTQSKKYLIEESIVMVLMNRMTPYKYELYPGKRNAVLEYVHNKIIKNSERCNLNHISLKFTSKNNPPNISKQPGNILDLVHQNPLTIVTDKKIICATFLTISKLIKDFIQSIQEFFIANNFDKFDPHVGDNLCQIRAAMLIEIHRTKKNIDANEVITKLKVTKQKYDQVIANLSLNLNQRRSKEERTKPKTTLKDYLKRENLDLYIPAYLKNIFYCYVLTKFKKHISFKNDVIDANKIKNFYNISNSSAKNLVRKWQNMLSKASCEFIIQNSDFSKNIGLFINRDDDGRNVLPSFLVTKIILKWLKKNRIPYELSFYDAKRRDYKILKMNFNITPAFSPVFAMRCSTLVSTNIRKLKEVPPEDLILYSTANHPQYNGKKLCNEAKFVYEKYKDMNNWCRNLNKEYISFCKVAKKLGYDSDKPDTGYIDHFYVSQGSNVKNASTAFNEQIKELAIV